jgi:molybdopterin molybdotransferase
MNRREYPSLANVAAREESVVTESSRHLKLLPISIARERIENLAPCLSHKTENISVEQALKRVCAETARSERDVPFATISAMDGYAICSSELATATFSKPVLFRVKGSIDSADSSPAPRRITGREAYQLGTGAVLPQGADTVVKMEETNPVNDNCIAIRRRIPQRENVCLQGEDVHRDQVILSKGRILTPADIALLIGAGKNRISVYKEPAVGILSIGDELKPFVNKSGTEEQGGSPNFSFRGKRTKKLFNNFCNLISGYLEELRASVTSLGVSKDDPSEIRNAIERNISELDMIITIGASSVGRRDYAFEAISELEDSEAVFHGVRVAPIRPAGLVMIGRRDSSKKKPVVILPAHAVSSALAFFLIALPIVNLVSGLEPDSRRLLIRASAQEAFENSRAIDSLLLASVRKDPDGNCYATPLPWGSNLIYALSQANGFVHLRGHERIEKSGLARVELLGYSELAYLQGFSDLGKVS